MAAKGQHLATRVLKVTVNVLQSIDVVRARSYALDAEVTIAVGTRHAVEGEGSKGRVSQVAVQPDQNALYRF